MKDTKKEKILYVLKWSGGKDSTFLLDELIKRNYPLDLVLNCDTGKEFPIMYEYILKSKDYFQKKAPKVKFILLNWGVGGKIWDKWALGKKTKGEEKGQVRGFPYSKGMDWCTRELKLNPSNKYLKTFYKGYKIVEYQGIAFNEPKRIPADYQTDDYLSKNVVCEYPLYDWKITENQIILEMKKRGLHNPLYNYFSRTGCWLCPKQSFTSFNKLYKNFPELWKELMEMFDEYKETANSKIKFLSKEEFIKKVVNFDKNGSLDLVNGNFVDKSEEYIGCFCK